MNSWGIIASVLCVVWVPLFFLSSFPLLKKEIEGLAKMWRKVARIIQGLQQFPYWGTVDCALWKRNCLEKIWDTGLLKHEYQEQGMVVNQLSSMQELQRSLRKLLAGGLKTNEVHYLCSEHQWTVVVVPRVVLMQMFASKWVGEEINLWKKDPIRPMEYKVTGYSRVQRP